MSVFVESLLLLMSVCVGGVMLWMLVWLLVESSIVWVSIVMFGSVVVSVLVCLFIV